MMYVSEFVLSCNSLTKRYGALTALDNVSFNVERGKIVGLLGPNGSGKTTLIKIANGLLTASGGEVLICGEKTGVETKKRTAYLSDCLSLPQTMSFDELVEFYGDFFENFNAEAARQMASSLNLEPDKKLKTLSKGTKEKVQLVLTMSRNADLYLLDEPMGGVDPATRDYILNTIISNYNENSSVVISTHLISDVENILDEVVFINNGQIVLTDSVDNIRENKGMSVDSLFREVFKC